MLQGGYPRIYDTRMPLNLFFSNYIDTYIERDVSEYLDGGWCRFVGLVVDSITTNHATRPSSRRRSMMLMPNSVLIRLSRYQTM